MADRINNINFTLSLRGMKGLGNSIAILLCGLFLYNSMGYIFVNSAIRSNLKKQVFAEICKLPDEFLVPITLHNTDKGKLIIEKNRIEIKLNGLLYFWRDRKDDFRILSGYPDYPIVSCWISAFEISFWKRGQ